MGWRAYAFVDLTVRHLVTPVPELFGPGLALIPCASLVSGVTGDRFLSVVRTTVRVWSRVRSWKRSR